MTQIYSFPLPVLFLLILIPSLVLGMGGVWLVRARGWMVERDDNDAIGLTHAFAGVLYAVALGLMVINVQSGYSEVEMLVMHEANLTADLYIDATGLAGVESSDIRALAREYTEAVVQEWQSIGSQADAELGSHEPIELLNLQVLSYEPVDDKDLVIYAEVLSGLNDMLDMRRERLHVGRDGVGPITWFVVILGALITIGMTWFYRTNNSRTHYGLVGIMSIMFGLMVFLIVAMDHPLLGRFSVDSGPFQEALEDMAAWEQHAAGLH